MQVAFASWYIFFSCKSAVRINQCSSSWCCSVAIFTEVNSVLSLAGGYMAFSCNFCSHGLVNLGKLGEGRVKALQRIWEEVKGANQHQHKSRILQQQCIRL